MDDSVAADGVPGSPISVATEDFRVRKGLTEAELAALLAGLGGDLDHFAVVEHAGRAPGHYIQTYRAEPDGEYEVEYRDGGPGRHFATRCADPDEVARLMAGWAAGTPGWDDGVRWRRKVYEPAPPQRELAEETRREAHRRAEEIIRSGYQSYEQACRSVSDHFENEEVSVYQAASVVAPLWRARVAEQDSWPATTDPDRIDAAFAELEQAHAITARIHFACCHNCGHTEIGGASAPGARGYVFGLLQDTEAVAPGEAIELCYGSFGDPDAAAGIAERVAEVVRGHGVDAEFTATGSLLVRPSDWRRRLPR